MPTTIRRFPLPPCRANPLVLKSRSSSLRVQTDHGVLSSEARIVKTPGICGGDARIRGTRIGVWLLAGFRQLGMSDVNLLEAYPTLRPADLTAAWQYADTHREEIDQALRENQ
jgi:uncharacterized protein (DUF433 family)